MKKTGIVIALCLVSASALLGCSAITGASASNAPVYQSVSVTTGDIVQTVSGPGVLKFADSLDQETTANVKITNVAVKAGDTVHAGDPIAEFDAVALSTDIANLYTSVTQLRQQAQALALSFQSGKTIAAGMKGRIKEVYVKEGDSVAEVVAEKGGIALISVDGLMTVQIQAAGLTANDEVTVVSGNYECKGNVSKIEGGAVTVSFPDKKVLSGSTVEVYAGGELIGSGLAQIDLPYLVPADDGIVTRVNVKANDYIAPFMPVAHVKYMTSDDAYQAVQDQLAQAQRDLDAAKALKEQGAILAEQDGIVASILPEGSYPNGTKFMSVYPQGEFEFTVAVDELDIFSIVLGQAATIQFDGVPERTFDAVVTKISSVGQVSNGFTTYTVTLRATDDGTLKSGLNGTVNIIINQRAGVLILPVEAIQEDSSGSFVTLAGSEQVKTPVTVGISDGSSIEILSGLAEGDQVVIRAAADIMANAQ
ncbi:MAG: HlyD family efflux transporter periplasmic adaptor subunit [Clostridiales bacterium]|nr:HlyD family efflux transporter periplasmic adaptor subunit [Clostridiales bacterium]